MTIRDYIKRRIRFALGSFLGCFVANDAVSSDRNGITA